MSTAAIAAARRLRDGGTLDACPHTTILELLQELELRGAEAVLDGDPIARAEDPAGAVEAG